jgi:hypothetical protein
MYFLFLCNYYGISISINLKINNIRIFSLEQQRIRSMISVEQPVSTKLEKVNN